MRYGCVSVCLSVCLSDVCLPQVGVQSKRLNIIDPFFDRECSVDLCYEEIPIPFKLRRYFPTVGLRNFVGNALDLDIQLTSTDNRHQLIAPSVLHLCDIAAAPVNNR